MSGSIWELHGTAWCILDGCTRPDCLEARRERVRLFMARTGWGMPRYPVPATPAPERVEARRRADAAAKRVKREQDRERRAAARRAEAESYEPIDWDALRARALRAQGLDDA